MTSLTQPIRPKAAVQPKPALRLAPAADPAPAQCCAKVTRTVAGCHN